MSIATTTKRLQVGNVWYKIKERNCRYERRELPLTKRLIKTVITTLLGLLLPLSAGAAPLCHVKKTEKLYNRQNVYAYNSNGDKATLKKELESICACESSYPGGKETPRHYEKDKTTVRYGRVTPNDRGLCQINERINGSKADQLGYDIETPYGNIKMANYLYEKYGEMPWDASSGCHR